MNGSHSDPLELDKGIVEEIARMNAQAKTDEVLSSLEGEEFHFLLPDGGTGREMFSRSPGAHLAFPAARPVQIARIF